MNQIDGLDRWVRQMDQIDRQIDQIKLDQIRLDQIDRQIKLDQIRLDRQIDRDSQRQLERERDRETHTHIYGGIGGQTNSQIYRLRERERGKKTKRE